MHTGAVTDVVIEVDRLADLFQAGATRRTPVRQRQLPMLEGSIRRHVAETLLTQVVPALLAELLEAAVDDLQPLASGEARSDLEALADAELRAVESVERCKAVLDASGLQALARLHSSIESSELARTADLTAAADAVRCAPRDRPRGWIDADELTSMEVCTATGLGQHDVRVRVDLALSRTPAAAALRSRLQQGSVSLHRACTIFSEIAALPPECGAGIVDAVLRAKDGAPPPPACSDSGGRAPVSPPTARQPRVDAQHGDAGALTPRSTATASAP